MREDRIQGKVLFFTDPKNIEADALAQIHRTASMPFVVGMAIMPDVHLGKGSTIGTVVLTEGVVMPACVGVDIGCGMIAAQTNLTLEEVKPHLQSIREEIERRVPTGFANNTSIEDDVKGRLMRLDILGAPTYDDTWRHSMCSLGGGNHFIEICIGKYVGGPALEAPSVWITLHSGSRGVGNKVARHHINIAKKLSDYTGESADLSPLYIDRQEGKDYLHEMKWAQEFAKFNREAICIRVMYAIQKFIPSFDEQATHPIVNVHHNYTERAGFTFEDSTYDTFITRKGAIAALEGKLAYIPGSMGTHSYVVKGLGNVDSFCSAPHGAGRRMSRRKAREQFTVEDLGTTMHGIESRVRPGILDEHPESYKDLDKVMEEAAELVSPVWKLTPIMNIKGD